MNVFGAKTSNGVWTKMRIHPVFRTANVVSGQPDWPSAEQRFPVESHSVVSLSKYRLVFASVFWCFFFRVCNPV